VRKPRRHRFALAVSLAGHAVMLMGATGGFQCIPEFEVPELDFELMEVDLVDPNALQGEQVEPDPEPPPPTPEPETPAPPPEPTPTDEASAEEKPPSEPEVEEPKKKKFAARGSRADQLAPMTSTFYALLVPKKIRRLPLAQQVVEIMAPLPDFELLIDGGRFDALRDFDHIVIASPDIRDWTQTFLAVDYRISREEVKRAIERAVATRDEKIEWVEDEGLLRGNPRPIDPEKKDADNRWFVFLEGKIAIYVREEFLPSILEGPSDDDRKTSGNYVAKLAKLRRFAARQPHAALQLVIKDLERNVKKNPFPFEIPDELEVSVSASQEPEISISLVFATVVEAKAFMKWWNEEIREMIDDNFTLRLQVGWAYDLLEVTREGKQVRMRGETTTDQAEKIMQFMADATRKMAGKTPEEIEEMRQRRLDALEARRGGKLPPSVLDPQVPDESPLVPDQPPQPLKIQTTTPKWTTPAPANPGETPLGTASDPPKPTKTPADGAVGETGNR